MLYYAMLTLILHKCQHCNTFLQFIPAEIILYHFFSSSVVLVVTPSVIRFPLIISMRSATRSLIVGETFPSGSFLHKDSIGRGNISHNMSVTLPLLEQIWKNKPTQIQ